VRFNDAEQQSPLCLTGKRVGNLNERSQSEILLILFAATRYPAINLW
jgi:hypothetical protein